MLYIYTATRANYVYIIIVTVYFSITHRIYSEEGELVATAYQQGLLKPKL